MIYQRKRNFYEYFRLLLLKTALFNFKPVEINNSGWNAIQSNFFIHVILWIMHAARIFLNRYEQTISLYIEKFIGKNL